MHKKMQDNEFLGIINSTPLVSIDLIIENHAGQYLLGKRTNRPAQGFWFVPGGRIRKGEQLAQAFQRISYNELGRALEIGQACHLGAYDHIYTDNFAGVEGVSTHYVALGYKIPLEREFDIQIDEQHSEVKWWSETDLLESDEVHQNTKNYFNHR